MGGHQIPVCARTPTGLGTDLYRKEVQQGSPRAGLPGVLQTWMSHARFNLLLCTTHHLLADLFQLQLEVLYLIRLQKKAISLLLVDVAVIQTIGMTDRFSDHQPQRAYRSTACDNNPQTHTQSTAPAGYASEHSLPAGKPPWHDREDGSGMGC